MDCGRRQRGGLRKRDAPRTRSPRLPDTPAWKRLSATRAAPIKNGSPRRQCKRSEPEQQVANRTQG